MYRRIVVKIGSNVISKEGHLEEKAVAGIVAQIAKLRIEGVDVIVVTSGAVATGKGILGSQGLETMPQRQVLAAVGQVGLMSLYARLFEVHGLSCAQVLATKGDFRDREHYANMKNCFENLLSKGIIPVVNNNDAITLQQAGFSDNDELAALIGAQVNADVVVFLSSVDYVLDSEGNPIVTVTEGGTILGIAKLKKSESGTGGMETKFKLAEGLMRDGINAVIANGRTANVIKRILDDDSTLGTRFIATKDKKTTSVKRRLAYAGGFSKGTAYVDSGAEKILLSKGSQSLLPVGVTKIEGAFKKGDTIDIKNQEGKRLGSGVAQYGADEAKGLVGTKGGKALIHYDYLFIG